MNEPLPQTTGYRRLHPLTPVLRGWKVFAAAVALAFQQMYGDVDLRFLFLLIAVSIPVAVVYGFFSWRATRYGIVGEDLIVETGVLNRRSRRVRLDRLQSVEVVRPLIARALGLAELRLEVAGGASSNAPLAYLDEPAAQRLRAELLARAAGLEIGAAEAPVAPEHELLTVPAGRLVGSILRSSLTVFSVLVVIGSIAAALLLRRWQPLLILGPAAISIVPALFASFAGAYDFRVAESPDGLRLRRGLLETRAQTVPPGRVQALRITSPWLWRSAGWFRVQVTVAGYAGEESSGDASTLLPVGSRADVDALVAIVFPGLDLASLALVGVPRRARWLDPFQRRVLGIGLDERFAIVRRGWLTSYLDVVPHEKLQSARLVQGPLQRRLEVASLRLDVTPGPVTVLAAHRDSSEARGLLEELIQRSRVARAAAAPERWMRQRP